MNNKKKFIILGLSLVLVIVLALATSYALFTVNLTKNSNFRLKIGNLALSISDTTNEDRIIVNDMVPTRDSTALENDGYNFTLTNTGTIDSTYTIYLDDVFLTNTEKERLSNDLVKVNLSPTNSINYSNTLILSERENRVILTGVLNHGDSINYTLRVWLDHKAGNSSQDKYFAGQLRIEGAQVEQVSLKNKILSANTVIEEVPNLTTVETRNLTGKIFKSTETNTGEPTYYFRGAVDNNYVKFANKIWRIVRINEDGTVRLILQDTTGTTARFNETRNSIEDIYYSNTNIDGGAKKLIDTWYKANIVDTGYDSYVATGNYFCEEDKVTGSLNNHTYIPNFRCSNNRLLNLNVALINYDELVFAGGFFNLNSNYSYYYLNNGVVSYTMSPLKGASSSYCPNWLISYDEDGITHGTAQWYFRPVINLKAGVMVTGAGTESDPYTVQTNKSYKSVDGILASFKKSDLKELVMCDDDNGEYQNCEIFNSIDTALASRDRGIIVLTDDIERTSPITISEGKDITLDLNNKQITSTGNIIENNGNFTVYNGKMISSGGIVIKNNNTAVLNINSGILVSEKNNAIYNVSKVEINVTDKNALYITSMAQSDLPAINNATNSTLSTINIIANVANKCTANAFDTTVGLCVYAEGNKTSSTNSNRSILNSYNSTLNINGGTYYGGYTSMVNYGLLNIKNAQIISPRVVLSNIGTLNLCSSTLKYDYGNDLTSAANGKIFYSLDVVFSNRTNTPVIVTDTGGVITRVDSCPF